MRRYDQRCRLHCARLWPLRWTGAESFVLSKIVHVGVTEHDVVQLHVASNLITIPERHSLRVLVWRLGEVPTKYGLIALVESSL